MKRFSDVRVETDGYYLSFFKEFNARASTLSCLLPYPMFDTLSMFIRLKARRNFCDRSLSE
jgi:hypothetical protein